MSTTLALTALLMGLAGGPHCAAMCGAACAGVLRGAGVVRGAGDERGAGGMRGAGVVSNSLPLWGRVGWGQRVVRLRTESVVGAAPTPTLPQRGREKDGFLRGLAAFQLGRLLGYTLAGALAGGAVQSAAWLSSQTAALRPVWTLFHLAVLAWGLALLVLARQPAIVERASRGVWSRVRPLAQARGGVIATGALWVFMPCGLLWSALLVASLSGGVLQGAASMALFALGSGVSLGLFPGVLRLLQAMGARLRDGMGTRLAGVLLAATAGWALWMDMAHRIAQWCGVAA